MSAVTDLPTGLLGIVCRKWAAATVARLGAGPMRFGNLTRAIPGLSRRVLAAELRRLVEDGVVQRKELPGRQRMTRYSLTALGRALHDILRQLRRWEGRHLKGAARRASAGRGYSDITT